jgi:hypothetical protein
VYSLQANNSPEEYLFGLCVTLQKAGVFRVSHERRDQHAVTFNGGPQNESWGDNL